MVVSSMPNAESPPMLMHRRYTLRDLLTTVFCDRRIFFSTFLVIFVLFIVIAILQPITFTAEARLLILMSREYTFRPEVGDASNYLSFDQNQVVRAELEILTNPMLIERVIDNIGINEVYPPSLLAQTFFASDQKEATGPVFFRLDWLAQAKNIFSDPTKKLPFAEKNSQNIRIDNAVRSFLKQLEVKPVKDANVLDLRFTHLNPDISSDVLNTLIHFYLDYRRSVFNQNHSKLISKQRDQFKERLHQSEIALENFREKHGINAFEDQKSLLLRQHAELKANKMDTDNRLQEVRARLAALNNALSKIPEEISMYEEKALHDAGDTARANLFTLEMRRNELLTKYPSEHRFIVDLDQQISQAKTMIKKISPKSLDSIRMGRNTNFDQVQADLIRTEAEASALATRDQLLVEQVEQLSKRLNEFNQLEQEYNNLILNRTLLEQNLKTYSQKTEETLIQEELDRQKSANIRVIAHAKPPSKSNNYRSFILFLGLFFGILGSIIAGIITDHTRATLISPESAERRLELPVLIAIALKSPPALVLPRSSQKGHDQPNPTPQPVA